MDDFLEHATDPDQRSQAWHDQHLGVFTSSQWSRLMEPVMIRRDMTAEELEARPKKGEGSRTTWIEVEDANGLSKGARTYIDEKVAEILTGTPTYTPKVAALQWGEDFEPMGKEYFTEVTGHEIEDVGFVKYHDIAGGTSDGKIIQPDGQKDWLFELKCPINPTIQMDYVFNLSAQTFREYKEHFWQFQMNLLWNKLDRGIFATFHPNMPDVFKLHAFVVEADPVAQKYGLEKLDLAEKEKQRILKLKITPSWQHIPRSTK